MTNLLQQNRHVPQSTVQHKHLVSRPGLSNTGLLTCGLSAQAEEDASDQEMQKFLAALAQLGSSSNIKAMQATHGPLQLLSGGAVGSHIMFSRFSLQEQLDSLLTSPPYIALAQDNPRLPAKVKASYAMSISPPQAQNARTPSGQGVLGVSRK